MRLLLSAPINLWTKLLTEAYLTYQSFFEEHELACQVFKAVPKATYDGFLSHPDILRFLQRHRIKLFVYNPDSQLIDKWIE